MDMELPTESPAGAVGANRLLQDLRDLPDEKVLYRLRACVRLEGSGEDG